MQFKTLVSCILFVLISQSTTSKDNLQQNINVSQAERWKIANSINTLSQTVKQYPFLIQNIKLQKFLDLIDYLEVCQLIGGDSGRYLIVDNQVYLFGKQNSNEGLQYYKKYLQKLLQKHKVPDMYLLIHVQNNLLSTQIKQQFIKKCKQIPMFISNKNISDYFTRTKFLLPHQDIIRDQWDYQVNQIRKNSLLYQWKDKIPKLFYRGLCTTNQHIQKNIPQSKKKVKNLKYCQECKYQLLRSNHPELVDAKCISSQIKTINNKSSIDQLKLYKDYTQQLAEQNKYRYFLSADSNDLQKNTAAFLFSSSVLIIPFSYNVQWFYRYLTPDINFVMFNNNYQKLFQKLKELQKNQSKAFQLIKNANNIAEKYLSAQAIANFTLQQITKYGNFQNLILNSEDKIDIKKGVDGQLVLKFKVMKQQWRKVNQLVSLENILTNFPQNQKNIQILRLIETQDTLCGIKLAKFLILDNQVRCLGEYCSDINAKGVYKMLNKLLKKYTISDTYFLIRVDQESSLSFSQNVNKIICKDLPYFIFSKDPQSQIQRKKFLFPHPQFQQFDSQIKNMTKKLKKIKWEQKINKAIFGGIINQDYNLAQTLKKFKFLQTLKLINSKKKYIQARVDKYFQENKEGVSNIEEGYKYVLIADQINTKYRKSQILAMLSRVVVILPRLKRVSWLDEKIIPGKHYVYIKNLSHLVNTIELLISNDQKIKKLSDDAFQIATIQLGTDPVQNYMSHVLKIYSKKQNLSLTKQQKQNLLNGMPLKNILKTKQTSSNLVQFLLVIVFFLLFLYFCWNRQKIQKRGQERTLDI